MLLALIRKELLAISRDIHGLAALFILPIIFIIVMSMALKDVYSPHVDKLAWSSIDQDDSELSQSLLERWKKANGNPLDLPADWRDAVREGQLKYVIQIEKGAEADLRETRKPEQKRILLLTDPAIDFGAFTSLRAQLEAITTEMRAESLMQRNPLLLNIEPADLHGSNVARAERVQGGPRPTAVQHNVPAWLVFGMFFVVTTIAGLFVEERSGGALSRLFSLGASPFILLLAKVLPFMVINCLQAGLMFAVGVYVIPLLGGDALSLQGINWLALLTMVLAISLAAISLALLVATLVRSQAQASVIGPMMNILMAAIGGIMVPTFVMPAVMQTLSHLSPMNWALEGLLNVLLRGGDLHNIRFEALRLLALAAISLGIAYSIFRYKKS
ncbi:ABC-2 type transport system permease protein [Paucimonas lemoignei]|uniref:ABC-2 type transport system permease protein n=1 Tax=Paucimonas lemoignei TaxID=29443 RepID=A0A4R3HXZ8_PAULE|nr:ABC transporter permease [Paucimonas lemoignei]TCS36339.1 ABC-2 type transport system permease protein [Paucimonas lemoignei]